MLLLLLFRGGGGTVGAPPVPAAGSLPYYDTEIYTALRRDSRRRKRLIRRVLLLG